ncbi:MAG: hypothetical protein Q9208_000614 [Pyrenodesmia sp. 3 TL-2023]
MPILDLAIPFYRPEPNTVTICSCRLDMRSEEYLMKRAFYRIPLIVAACIALTCFIICPFRGGLSSPSWTMFYATVGLALSLWISSLAWFWVYVQEQLPRDNSDWVIQALDGVPKMNMSLEKKDCFAFTGSKYSYVTFDLKAVTGRTWQQDLEALAEAPFYWDLPGWVFMLWVDGHTNQNLIAEQSRWKAYNCRIIRTSDERYHFIPYWTTCKVYRFIPGWLDESVKPSILHDNRELPLTIYGAPDDDDRILYEFNKCFIANNRDAPALEDPERQEIKLSAGSRNLANPNASMWKARDGIVSGRRKGVEQELTYTISQGLLWNGYQDVNAVSTCMMVWLGTNTLIIAAIIGIAGAGFRLSLVLNAVGAELATADVEIQTIARAISNYAFTLKQLALTLESAKSIATHSAMETAKRIADQSQAIFDDIKDMTDLHQRTDDHGNIRSIAVNQRVNWCFKQQRLQYLLGQLESLKLSLSVMVQVLQLGKLLVSTRYAGASLTSLWNFVLIWPGFQGRSIETAT